MHVVAFLLELNRWHLNHPLTGNGYQSWSGIVSDIGEVTLLTGMAMALVGAYRKIECHQSGCHRIGRFTHGHFHLCHVHHPLVPSDGKITSEHIDAETARQATASGSVERRPSAPR